MKGDRFLTDSGQRRSKRFRRIITIFAPFLLLLLLLIWLNRDMLTAVRDAAPGAQQQQTVATAVPGEPSTTAEAAAPAATGAAPTATAVPLPTLPPDSTIQLLGPPAASVFAADAAVVFYWAWTTPLSEAFRFELHITGNGPPLEVAAGFEPNIGLGYNVTLPAASLPPGSYSWSIRLVQADGRDVVRESEQRPLTLTAGSGE